MSLFPAQFLIMVCRCLFLKLLMNNLKFVVQYTNHGVPRVQETSCHQITSTAQFRGLSTQHSLSLRSRTQAARHARLYSSRICRCAAAPSLFACIWMPLLQSVVYLILGFWLLATLVTPGTVSVRVEDAESPGAGASRCQKGVAGRWQT